MAGTSPAMTESESTSSSWREPQNASCCFGHKDEVRAHMPHAHVRLWGGARMVYIARAEKGSGNVG